MRYVHVVITLIISMFWPFAAHSDSDIAIALSAFSFVDTSGEPDDQANLHKQRIMLFLQTVEMEYLAAADGKLGQLACIEIGCSASNTGIATLSNMAIKAQANHLLVGEVKKMSTLIGQVKYALIDLKTNRPLCDRYLSYRGDTDEAWQRAARFLVKDLRRHCQKK